MGTAGAQEDGVPAGSLGQPQEVHDSGDVDAFAQRGGNDGFHQFLPVSPLQKGHLTAETAEQC